MFLLIIQRIIVVTGVTSVHCISLCNYSAVQFIYRLSRVQCYKGVTSMNFCTGVINCSVCIGVNKCTLCTGVTKVQRM